MMELLGTIYGGLGIIFLLGLAWFVLVARGTSSKSRLSTQIPNHHCQSSVLFLGFFLEHINFRSFYSLPHSCMETRSCHLHIPFQKSMSVLIPDLDRINFAEEKWQGGEKIAHAFVL